MTLPASGAISLSMVATELGVSNVGLSLDSANARALAQKPSGPISLSDFYGKSANPVQSGTPFTSGTITNANPLYNSYGNFWGWHNVGGVTYGSLSPGSGSRLLNGGRIARISNDYTGVVQVILVGVWPQNHFSSMSISGPGAIPGTVYTNNVTGFYPGVLSLYCDGGSAEVLCTQWTWASALSIWNGLPYNTDGYSAAVSFQL